jgi:hypothetical protein
VISDQRGRHEDRPAKVPESSEDLQALPEDESFNKKIIPRSSTFPFFVKLCSDRGLPSETLLLSPNFEGAGVVGFPRIAHHAIAQLLFLRHVVAKF